MRLNLARLRHLLHWVVDLVPASYLPGKIEILEGQVRKSFRGYAFGSDEVKLHVPAILPKYPRRYTYRKGAGALRFGCPCDEFVALVAHELRHVGQSRAPKAEQPGQAEIDAEAFARFALEKFQARKRCRHGATA